MARPGRKRSKPSPSPSPKNETIELLRDIRKNKSTSKFPTFYIDASLEKTIEQLKKYTDKVKEYEDAFRPVEGAIRGDQIFKFDRWIKLSELKSEERREKFKTYHTDELDNMIDDLLDEIEDRRKRKQKTKDK